MSIGNALGSIFKSSRVSKIIRSERENNKRLSGSTCPTLLFATEKTQ